MEKLLTESEKVEQLMRPRYRVIALWPNTEFKIGDITEPEYNIETAIRFYNDFPHLFRKLEWWQERSIDEMPEFVRWEIASPDKGAIEKALKWTMRGQIPFVDLISQVNEIRAEYFTPATEAEFIKYISK